VRDLASVGGLVALDLGLLGTIHKQRNLPTYNYV